MVKGASLVGITFKKPLVGLSLLTRGRSMLFRHSNLLGVFAFLAFLAAYSTVRADEVISVEDDNQPTPTAVPANPPAGSTSSPQAAPQSQPKEQAPKSTPTPQGDWNEPDINNEKQNPDQFSPAEDNTSASPKKKHKNAKFGDDEDEEVAEPPENDTFKFKTIPRKLEVTADGQYSYGFGSGASERTIASGYGANISVEMEFPDWLALGVFGSLTYFPTKGNPVLVGPIGAMGRIIPLRQGLLEGYLIGGLGLNSTLTANPISFPGYYVIGNFFGFAGAGFRYDFKDNFSFDANATYNYYSPDGNPLNAVSLRAGFSYAIPLRY
jgi:hypothetical protein